MNLIKKNIFYAKAIFYIFILLSVSSIFSRYQYIYVAPMDFLDDGVDNIYPLVLRELCWLLLGIMGLFYILKSRNKTLILSFISLYIVFLTVRDFLNYNLDNIIFGYRILLVFMSFFSIAYMCENLNIYKIGERVSYLYKIIILCLMLVILYQIKYFPPTFGATFLGPRVNGFYQNPIIFSMFLGAISLIFYVTKTKNYKYWVILVLLMSFFTGGRLGILVNLLILFVCYFSYFTRSKISFFATIALLFPIIFLLISSSKISGREGTADNKLNDGRFDVWSNWLMPLNESVANFFLGISVGTGTNASVRFSNNAVADSMYMTLWTSFGFIGLLILFVIIFYYCFKLKLKPFFALMMALIMGIGQNIPEINPINLIIVFSIVYSYYFESTKKKVGL